MSTLAWERRGLVLVGREVETYGPIPEPLTAADVAQMIACPRCGARVHQSCKTATGNSTEHVERLIPRRCLCGELIERKHTYCEPCRVAQRGRTYWLREVATPTALRRRQVVDERRLGGNDNERESA